MLLLPQHESRHSRQITDQFDFMFHIFTDFLKLKDSSLVCVRFFTSSVEDVAVTSLNCHNEWKSTIVG
jgi:hypothetical protein